MKYNKLLTVFSIFILLFVFSIEAYSEYDQAPMLEDKVESGDLPPVEERVPEEPLEVEANNIGDYGGTALTGGTSPDGWGEDLMLMDVTCGLVEPKADGSGLRMNLAKDIEESKDKTSFTVHLREGVKWSDGHPFTTDDIEFWYEDVLLNEKLTPAIGQLWKTEGEVVDLKIIDDYTFQFNFTAPKPYFLNYLVHSGSSLLTPKHYLKDFHPNYTSEKELDKKVKEEDFDNWWELFGDKNATQMHAPLDVDLPTLGTYRLVKKGSSERIYERNPYFWKIDKEGNQLPYIDKIRNKLVSDKEVLNGKALSGEIDFLGWDMDIRNYPMFQKYAEESGFKTSLWEAGYGATSIYMLNQTNEDEDLREIFQNPKFRQALSLAIDRDEINEAIYFGKAEPRQYTVLESSKYYEPEFAKAYIEYEPEKAEEMLDEMGLKDTDGDGWRERPDGENLTFTIEYFPGETPKTAELEIVSSNWRDIGVKVEHKQVSAGLQQQRAPGNMMDATIWHGDRATDILFFEPRKIVPIIPHWGSSNWPKWASWFNTEGESGWEPPEDIKEYYGWWEEMQTEPDLNKRIELGKKILRSQAENLYVIGTVGKVPWPILINDNLKNVPEKGIWAWDTLWTSSRNPGSFYFENGRREE
ncbi:MAG: ABC transporter substrate-binding protein [Halanaerobiales bacterium]